MAWSSKLKDGAAQDKHTARVEDTGTMDEHESDLGKRLADIQQSVVVGHAGELVDMKLERVYALWVLVVDGPRRVAAAEGTARQRKNPEAMEKAAECVYL